MIQLRSLGKVFSGIKGFYNELNPATLTGALDVIVVEDNNGTFYCGPFHVRFGKMGALNPADKTVEIYVNGEPVNFLHMRLGSAGYAYFVEDLNAVAVDSDSDSNLSGSFSHSDGEGSLFRMLSADDLTKNSIFVNAGRRRRRRPRKEGSSIDVADRFCFDSLYESPNSLSTCSFNSDNMFERTRSESLCTVLPGEHKLESLCASTSAGNSECGSLEPQILNESNSLLMDLMHPSHKEVPATPTGVYLEDLVTPQVDETVKQAYIYMNNKLDKPVDQYSSQELNVIDAGYRSDTEQSSKFSNMCLSMVRDLRLSLCGGLSAEVPINEEEFCASLVTFEDFSKDPAGIIANPNLVVQFNGKFYNWNMAAPLLLSFICFRTELPFNTIRHLEDTFMPKKRPRRKAWFSWGVCEPEVVTTATSTSEAQNTPIPTEQSREIPTIIQSDPQSEPNRNEAPEVPGFGRLPKKIHLTSSEILNLDLRPGANSVEFRIVTKFQGTYSCSAKIYLWRSDDQLVVSDVDGTITRSDLLGHVLPMLGRDWTHDGVAELYSKIASNGYKFVYLSARAIGQAGVTRNYIEQVLQHDKYRLPDGPILLSPSSLIDALHREVIEGKPEIFKIKCLSEIQSLFGPNASPFFASFGNRQNDVLAYTEAGFQICRIFTVNSNGMLKNEHLPTQSSSFKELISITDYLFPCIPQRNLRVTDDLDNCIFTDSEDEYGGTALSKSENPPVDMSIFSSFSYWRGSV